MPDTHQPGFGHNSGGITPDIDTLIDPGILTEQWTSDNEAGLKRRDELLARCEKFRSEHPDGISTEAEAEFASDLAGQVKAAAGPAETLHEMKKAPFLAAGRAADAFFVHGWANRLNAAVAYFSGAGIKGAPVGVITQYHRNKEAALRQKLLEEAEAKRVEAARAQAAAEATRSADVVDNAIAATEAAEKAQAAANAPAADLSRTRGAFGTSSSLRANWTWEGEDLMELVKAVAAGTAPLNYLTYNVQVIGGAVRPRDGVREIPGVKIWNASSSQVRK